MTGTTATAGSRSSVWAGYAAAAWALIFALRGAYWALGGTVGLNTLSPGLQQAAESRDPEVFAALWVTVALELVGFTLALALVRPWGEVFPAWVPFVGGRKVPTWLLLLPAWGAGTLLAGHGGLFVSFGVLAARGGEALTTELRWYSFFWGPWFLLGGLLFMAAGVAYARRSPDRRFTLAASAVGALGGLLAAAAPLIVSALAQNL